jgi:uncharacterized protein (TIGR00375 family)
LWLEELKRYLQECGNGLYAYDGVHFVLTAEISSIYSKNGRGHRIHNMVFAPSFKTVDAINAVLARHGNLASDGRPILGMDAEEVARIVFDIDERCMLVPGHIWTPWFSLFGSMSGFNRIEDCFGAQTSKIFALETGLSSDPGMNWRLSALDRFSLISNSDSHSPSKIGREANVFKCELTYDAIRDVLRTKDSTRFLYTIEFFPEEGKYHFDGHRLCGVSLAPEETRRHNALCPRCGKPVTVGVMNRVEQLADRPPGFVPKGAIPYKNIVPLDEIIAESKKVSKTSMAVEREYLASIAKFGTEFEILLYAPEKDLRAQLSPRLAEGIIGMRAGKVSARAGYDGEYGVISVYAAESNTVPTPAAEQQLNLF